MKCAPWGFDKSVRLVLALLKRGSGFEKVKGRKICLLMKACVQIFPLNDKAAY